MSVIFLSNVARTPGGQYRVEALRTGHWDYPGMEQGLNVTPTLLQEMVANFNAGVKGFEQQVNREHDDERPCGWVKKLELSRDGNAIYALFDVTDTDTKKLVDNGSLKYCSSELDLGWFDPERKKTHRVFEGLALTNRPYVKRMQPIAPVNLSEFEKQFAGTPVKSHKEARKQMAETPADAMPGGGSAVKLAETEAKLVESQRRESTYKAELAELKKQVRATEAKVRLSEFKAKLDALVRRGRVTLPQYQMALSLGEAILNHGSPKIQLATKVKLMAPPFDSNLGNSGSLAEPPAEEETDQVDVLDSITGMLQQNPDSIAVDPKREAMLGDENPEWFPTDEDEKLDQMAKAEMREDKSLSYEQAVKLAEKKVMRGGARR